jgi:hypothetical protein
MKVRIAVAVLGFVALFATTSEGLTEYAVDGIEVGTPLSFKSASYREYRCRPSEQLNGLTWCQKTRSEREQRGTTTFSLLHSGDGTVSYLNRAQELRSFNPRKAEVEIERYSRTLGETPHILKMPRQNGVLDAMIAVWGKATLEQLDRESIKVLANGKSPKKGLLIDFLANFVRSAKEGLPIFRIEGGPGLVWAVRFDQKGNGTVRLAAVDGSGLLSLPPDHKEQMAKISEDVTEASEAQQPRVDQPIQNIQSEPAGGAAINEDFGKPKASDDMRIEAATTAVNEIVEPRIEEIRNPERDKLYEVRPSETKRVAETDSNVWGNVNYGSIAAGLLLILTALSLVMLRLWRTESDRAPNDLQACSKLRKAPAKSRSVAAKVVPYTLSPEAALARIESIRQSLLLDINPSAGLLERQMASAGA